MDIASSAGMLATRFTRFPSAFQRWQKLKRLEPLWYVFLYDQSRQVAIPSALHDKAFLMEHVLEHVLPWQSLSGKARRRGYMRH